ncbi:hypothetical protein IWX90DRAFT_378454, partial [Phyllosticta citrichinensis]
MSRSTSPAPATAPAPAPAPAPAEPTSPNSPNSFLAHVRQLTEKRDKEDAERSRLLEEQILQGRAERAARRAERQRSLSPDKTTSQVASPSSIGPRDSSLESRQDMDSPTRHMSHRDTLQRLVGTDPAHDETAAPTNASPKPSQTSSLSRSNTVSWQQRRPNSSAGRRPLSFASPDNPASKSSTPAPSTPAAAEELVSRSEIARSLGSKDPSWFKQTPDRGIGSPAYRRSQEDVATGADVMPGRRPLPAAPLRDSMASSAVSPPP